LCQWPELEIGLFVFLLQRECVGKKKEFRAASCILEWLCWEATGMKIPVGFQPAENVGLL